MYTSAFLSLMLGGCSEKTSGDRQLPINQELETIQTPKEAIHVAIEFYKAVRLEGNEQKALSLGHKDTENIEAYINALIMDAKENQEKSNNQYLILDFTQKYERISIDNEKLKNYPLSDIRELHLYQTGVDEMEKYVLTKKDGQWKLDFAEPAGEAFEDFNNNNGISMQEWNEVTLDE